MKFNTIIYLASILSSVKADNYKQGDDYSTFTPSQGILSGATTQFTQTFGIAINPIISSVVLSSVTTKSNGDVVATQINDGQIQAATSNSAVVVTQIGDGQIQATTSTETTPVQVVSQIGDGQIQATTLTTVTTSSSSSTITTANLITQIGDGQIQATTSTSTSSSSDDTDVVVTHITEIVKQYVTVAYSDPSSTITSSFTSSEDEDVTTYLTVTPTTTVYATLTSATLPTLAATTLIVDKRDSKPEPFISFEKRDLASTCLTNSSLAMTLVDSVLYDSKGRIGSIVSNDQFQFDGPTPQEGAIYTAGWSIYNGKLALGQSTIFYQCLSGNFYNLYDISIGSQCTAVELDVVLLVDC